MEERKPDSMNRPIVVSAVVITVGGVATAIAKGQAITKVVVGGYIFLGVCSLMDTLGGRFSTFASLFATLAMVYVIVTELLPNLMIVYNKLLGNQAGNTGSGLK